jgi:small subunit ribosomal protein S6
MARTWRKYETLILIDAGLGMEATEEFINRFRQLINTDGRMLKTDRWGVRNTAFEIKHHTKAYYLMLEYAGEGVVSTQLEHALNLLDSIIKFQTIKLAEGLDPEELPTEEENIIPEEPAAEEEAAEEAAPEAATEVAAEEATEAVAEEATEEATEEVAEEAAEKE